MFEKINQLYKDFETFEVSKLKIPFNSDWKQIGVNLSGGADSACMTMLLCDHIMKNKLPTKIYVITFIRCWNTRPWQKSIAENVFSYLKKAYPHIIKDQIFCFIAPEIEHGAIGEIFEGRSGDQMTVSGFNRYCAVNYQLDTIFNATSKNPSDTNFDDRMKNRDIDPETPFLNFLVNNRKETKTFNPFVYTEKDWIIAQYKIFNRWDLFEITRSCEGDFITSQEIQKTVVNFEDYYPGLHIKECGLCFWCKEREWALIKYKEVIEKLK